MTDSIFRQKVFVNVGSGVTGEGRLPPMFEGWRQLRVDIDPETHPDVVADLTDLSRIEDACADAVWASHCVEHLYRHEVGAALGEIRRILRPDGLACILTPDLQTVASVIAEDRLHEVLYQSPAGPITPHDVVFGFGHDVARGRIHMAHRCGFTPAVMVQSLSEAGFDTFVIRRRPYELFAVARRTPWTSDEERMAQLAALGL